MKWQSGDLPLLIRKPVSTSKPDGVANKIDNKGMKENATKTDSMNSGLQFSLNYDQLHKCLLPHCLINYEPNEHS